MNLTIYQVDAFTDQLFGGNPAAVCPLTKWLPTEIMQKLANENNLSETVFFVREGEHYNIRWFTPELEIDLAGHPTLAAAFVIFNILHHELPSIHFRSKSGSLYVHKKEDLFELDFPSRMPQPHPHHELALIEGINIQPQEVLKSRDFVLVYKNEAEVKKFIPDYEWLNKLDTLGIIVTAPGNDSDFVSRFFVPNSVIGEDPVTGSAHATLIPYWSKVLNKKTLFAKQVSRRGGQLWCEDKGERVAIAGKAVLYMKGEYFL